MLSMRPDLARPVSRSVDAAEALASALLEPGGLSRDLKEQMLEVIATGREPEGNARDVALGAFARRLARHPSAIGPTDLEPLRSLASEGEILEAVLTAGVAQLSRTLAAGLGAPTGWIAVTDPAVFQPVAAPPRPYLGAPLAKPGEFAPFDLLRQRLGFVPALFKAQTLNLRALEAEIRALAEILFEDGPLSRVQKESILLAVSAAKGNTYVFAVHGEILRNLGVPVEVSDRIASDHRKAGLSDTDVALLDLAVALATRPEEFGRGDSPSLERGGVTPEAKLDMVATTALTSFLNTVERGLNPKPDFRPRRDFAAERAELERERAAEAQRAREPVEDPDAELVASVRRGDVNAFEQLLRRHQGRVYRTLAGLTGQPEDAEDCTQAVFVKVFQKIGDFSGASRFSTWLTRIAINEGLEALRRRRPTLSLETDDPAETEFRPVSLAPWVDDPERLYARDETRRIVQANLASLPDRYRIAVYLRDIEQLSTAEAANALGIPVPSLKTRLLRGRLMLREALAPYFGEDAKGGRDV